jgi:hypothetical protein
MIRSCIDKYTEYYETINHNRILTWDHTRGLVTLSVKFVPTKKRKEGDGMNGCHIKILLMLFCVML